MRLIIDTEASFQSRKKVTREVLRRRNVVHIIITLAIESFLHQILNIT